MKICFIHNLYPPYARGGAEGVVLHQVAEHRKQGDEVIVVTLAPWQSLRQWGVKKIVEDTVVVYRVAVPNVCSYMNLVDCSLWVRLIWHCIDIWNVPAARMVKRILIEEQPDIVHTHNLMGISFLLPKFIKRLGMKHIHTVHDVQLITPSGILPWNHTHDFIFDKIYQAIMKRLFKNTDEIIFPSVFLQKFYEKHGFFVHAKTEVKHNFLPINFSSIDIKQPPCQHFLYVGGLEVHKGIRVLFDAWESLPKKLDIFLSLVGDGAMRQKVEDWTLEDPRVQALGWLDAKLLAEYYTKVDVLIFTSICIENTPNVLYEAMRNGLRIIASNTGGVNELIGSYTGATIVEPDNIEVLAKEIKKIVEV